jgi:hypothetical protein
MSTTAQPAYEANLGLKAIAPPSVRQVKNLIWIYFWLIIFEGALRKWVLPMLSDPLLLIRDPVVMLIYLQALRGGFFPKHWLVKLTVGLGAFTFLWGCTHVYAGGSYKMLLVTLYGVRTYFLHLPLIFIIGHVFSRQDVVKVGKWCLILAVPMAVLMAAQYRVGDGHWLNKATTGDDSGQIAAAMGKIRPPGLFSFITGPATFYPLVTVFLVYGVMRKGTYPKLLMLVAAAATFMVLPVSGSRTLVLSCGLVVLFGVVALFRIPSLVPRFAIWAAVVGFGGTSLLTFPIGREAVESFSKRWEQATDYEGQGQGARVGVARRMTGSFTEVFYYLPYIPFTGHGIGAGTNVGVKLITGKVGFLYGEAEWTRNVMEAGPVLGFAYIGFRSLLSFYLLGLALRKLKAQDPLPWLFMSCAFVALLTGQTSQPTTLGFMAFIAGLSLSSVEVMARHVPLSENQRRRMQQAERIARKRRTSGALTADGGTI